MALMIQSLASAVAENAVAATEAAAGVAAPILEVVPDVIAEPGWFETTIELIVHYVHEFGYIGLFVMSFLESTFTPIPSEVTMIPAGYLVHQGKMHVVPVMVSCVAGALAGSYFTYWLAIRYGTVIVKKYGKYMTFTEAKMRRVEAYFENHGAISIFSGRLIPGVRHVISFPAGLARMNLKSFFLYTFLGSTLWMGILFWLGYFIGDNEQLLKKNMVYIKLGLIVAVALVGAFYYCRFVRNKRAIHEAVVEE